MHCTKLKTYMETGRVVFLPPSRIQPNPAQPRTEFSPEHLEELAQSIRIHGILQPLSVRRMDTHYQLIAGERRYRAAQIAGLREIPCIVMQMTDQESGLAALLENLQRQDLNYIEEARAYSAMMTRFSLSQEQVAKAVGKSQSAVANTLRILRHSPPVLEKLLEHDLTQRHARALLKLNDEPQKLAAISHITRNHLSVAQTESYIDSLLHPKPSPGATSLPAAGGGVKGKRSVCRGRMRNAGGNLPEPTIHQACTQAGPAAIPLPSRQSRDTLSPGEGILSQILQTVEEFGIPHSQTESPTHITLTLHIPKICNL